MARCHFNCGHFFKNIKKWLSLVGVFRDLTIWCIFLSPTKKPNRGIAYVLIQPGKWILHPKKKMLSHPPKIYFPISRSAGKKNLYPSTQCEFPFILGVTIWSGSWPNHWCWQTHSKRVKRPFSKNPNALCVLWVELKLNHGNDCNGIYH